MKNKKLLTKKLFDIPVGKHIKLNIWTIPMLILATFSDLGIYFALAYISSGLHELAHIFCAKSLNVKISYVSIYPFGISARLKKGYIKNSEKEFLIAFSGPLLSIVLFWIFAFFGKVYPSPYITFLRDTNFAICSINLLPCLPLDGGRMAKSILTLRFGIMRAYGFMLKISKIILLILIVFEIIIIFASRLNFSLVLISAFLLQNLAFEKQAVSMITLKEILSSHKKTENSQTLPTKVLCVKENSLAAGFLRYISYDCFYVLNVLNEKSAIVNTITEVEVLDSLLKNGIRIKYKDIKNF